LLIQKDAKDVKFVLRHVLTESLRCPIRSIVRDIIFLFQQSLICVQDVQTALWYALMGLLQCIGLKFRINGQRPSIERSWKNLF